ncbi:GTPase-associated protein 1-related protein [Streptomyces sp. NPDC003077]|uniref:GTPase-associated protein 1-related protein n=1 Tax=Streptomyces sp. NPDC003077 TaxID=3154443 RepID=UPI0033B55CB1
MAPFPQLHYTSAAPGADGSGFRFTAVSPGVDPALLRQVEPLLGYEPPRDAPARPSERELAAFPVAFGFTRLTDGTGLLSRTVYTGADYSGRYGNFHAHALLLPPDGGLPGRMLPVEAWGSADWRSATAGDAAPPPSAGPRPGGRFGRRALTGFAWRHGERLAPFLADVRRLFAAEPGPPLVIVESGSEEVARWVALACGALPHALAARLTFLTYTHRPYLAEQQIVGVFPDADFGFTPSDLLHQYRVHHCVGGPSSPARQDPWAAVAARVWLAGRPDLFVRAGARSADAGDPFEDGTLAALALGAGITLDGAGRSAAVRWASGRAHQEEAPFWQAFLGTLLAEDPANPEPPAAPEALLGLLDALAVHRPREVTEPLARFLVRRSVTGSPPGPVPAAGRTRLGPEARRELGRELGAALCAELGAAALPMARGLALLRLAEELGVDAAPAVPALSARVVGHLLADAGDPPAAEVAAALAGPGRAALRQAVFDRLNDAATGDDPRPVVRVLAALLPYGEGDELSGRPHLRLAAAAGRAGGGDEGPALLRRLLREAGPGAAAEPSLLATAYRLAWTARRPSAADARALLAGTPDPLLTASGLDRDLVAGALEAAPDDPDAPGLAAELLRRLPEGTGSPAARERAALRLLCHAEEVRSGRAGPGFTAYAVALLPLAEPLEEGVGRRLGRALAARLLGGPVAEGDRLAGVPLEELGQLARAGDGPLLTAYEEEATGPVLRARLRDDPHGPAACFVAWNSHAGASPGWDALRHRLLEDVLRPAVRRLPDDALAAVEDRVSAADAGWADAWRRWRRPGFVRRWGRLRGGGRGPSGSAGDGHRSPPGNWTNLAPDSTELPDERDHP